MILLNGSPRESTKMVPPHAFTVRLLGHTKGFYCGSLRFASLKGFTKWFITIRITHLCACGCEVASPSCVEEKAKKNGACDERDEAESIGDQHA
jgi:hypothetical protein